jgi:subtilisin-like proprotein convertase family protein
MIARMLTVVLAALLALPAGASEPPSVAAKKTFKTVTQTFTNNGQIGDPAAGGATVPYPAILEVSGLKRGKITDVNLMLHGYSHTFPGAIGVMLVAPNGRDAVVMNDVGGNTDVENISLILDDEAVFPMPNGSQLISGQFKPTWYSTNTGPDGFPAPAPLASGNVALSTFDGGNPNGAWKLFVRDSLGGVGGISGGFSLEITAKVKKSKSKSKNKKK